jgi:hypothetical protein
MKTTNTESTPDRNRRLVLVPSGYAGREDALRRVRDVRRHIQPRSERFAYLKRGYD